MSLPICPRPLAGSVVMPKRHPGAIPVHWRRTARAKGFRIRARVRDRLHLALGCRTCGASFVTRLYTLMSATPLCPACLETRRAAAATAAGVVYRGADPQDTRYGLYRAPCGHDLRRQFGLMERVAQGQTGLRCETCHVAKDAALAAERGWTLLGAATNGKVTYRRYRHRACGHVQDIARGNMLTGRFDCAGCGVGWSAAPSCLYLIGLTHPDGRTFVKLGYSRDPAARMIHQLGLAARVRAVLLRTCPVATGHTAQKIEKALHRELRHAFPEAVVPAAEIRPWTNVVSEIYAIALRGEIDRRLDAVERDMTRATAAGADTFMGTEGHGADDDHPVGSRRLVRRTDPPQQPVHDPGRSHPTTFGRTPDAEMPPDTLHAPKDGEDAA